MSDIDFDELDREVSKLVGNSKPDNQPSEPTETKEDAGQAVETHEAPPVENTSPMIGQSAVDEGEYDSTIAIKPRGRFMDMVHPSSDMAKEGAAVSQLSAGTERQSITPLSDSDSLQGNLSGDDMKSDIDDTSSKKEELVTASHEGGDREEPTSPTDMPDPIDVHESLSDTDLRIENETPDEQEVKPDVDTTPDMPVVGVKSDAGTPEIGPFVADAKEEKRPLGQFSDTVEPEKSESDKEIDKILSQEDNGEAEGDKPDTVQYNLPPELEKDLVAIEAGESPDEILSSVEDKDDTEKTEKKEEKTEEDSVKDDDISKKLDDTSAALLASGSIPQQYKIAIKEKAGIKDDDNSQLFKAEHYETSPAKKSHHKSKVASVLQWFFIIVGIILLGSTIGFAVFRFVSSQ